MKYLLDSDHVSILQNEDGPEHRAILVHTAKHAFGDIGVSVVTVHEQFLGAHTFINRARDEKQIIRGYELLFSALEDFQETPILPFTADAAELFTKMLAQKVRIDTMDLRIAVTALVNYLIVVTRNSRHFSQVPGLAIEDWTK